MEQNKNTEPEKQIGLPKYGVIDNGVFGSRIVTGIVTGLRFTENEPLYELSFGKNSWWTSQIADNTDDLFKFFNLAPLERVKDTHGLQIKFGR